MQITRTTAGFTSLAFFLALLLMASSARAGTKDGHFAVEGPGRAKCAAFTTARTGNTPDLQRYMGFIEGYLTAANRYEPNTFDLTPWHNADAFAAILDVHCKKHPGDTLVMSAQRLVASTQPVRLAEFSKLIEVGAAGKKTIVYEAIMKRAQRALIGKGLYKGEANGHYDANVKDALVQFQRMAKLDPTGLPDPATLWVLLNP